MSRQAVKEWVLQKGMFLAAAFLLCGVVSSGAAAQQSELQQQILAPDCSSPDSCEMKAPTIKTVNKNGGRPILTGTYDAAFTKTLQVTFGGRRYTLGIDSELTVKSGTWQLSLRALPTPLKSGEYIFAIEATGYNNSIQKVQTTLLLAPADIATDPVSPDVAKQEEASHDTVDVEDSGADKNREDALQPDKPVIVVPQPTDPREKQPRVALTPLALAVGSIGSILLVALWRWNQKKQVKKM